MRREVIFVIVVAIAACADEKTKRTRGGKRGPTPVRVEKVTRGSIEKSLDFPAELVAPEAVELAAKLSGRIEQVRVRMGERVEAGAVLAELNNAQLYAQYQEAKAALAVAQASQRRAAVEDQNAAAELARKQPLAAQDLITRQELDNVRTKRSASAAGLELAAAQIAQAEARVQLLGQQLADCRITAPFSGWVDARYLDAGAVVTPQVAVLRLVRTNPIVVQFQVPEREIGTVRTLAKAGLDVELWVDALPGKPFEGKVARVSPSLTRQSRAAQVEAEVKNEDGALMPGMYGRAHLDLGTREDALLAPLVALSDRVDPNEKGQRLFVVRGGHARQVNVTIGQRDGDYGEVLDGLSEGDAVVVEGMSGLSDDAQVEVVGERRHHTPTGAIGP